MQAEYEIQKIAVFKIFVIGFEFFFCQTRNNLEASGSEIEYV